MWRPTESVLQVTAPVTLPHPRHSLSPGQVRASQPVRAAQCNFEEDHLSLVPLSQHMEYNSWDSLTLSKSARLQGILPMGVWEAYHDQGSRSPGPIKGT